MTFDNVYLFVPNLIGEDLGFVQRQYIRCT